MGVLPLGEFANVERFEFAPRVGWGEKGDLRGNPVSTMVGSELKPSFFFPWGIKIVPVPFL